MRLRNLEASWTYLQTLVNVVTTILAALTIFIAVASLVGIATVRTHIKKIVRKRTKQQYLILSARLKAAQGTVFGDVSLNDETQVVDRARLLDRAIDDLQNAAEKLSATKSEVYPAVRNNLAFFYAVRAHNDPKYFRADAEEAIEIANELRSTSSMRRNPSFIDTHARIVSAFHQHFPDERGELQRAVNEIVNLLNRDDTSGNQRAHSKITLLRLLEAADKLDKTFGDKLRTEAKIAN